MGPQAAQASSTEKVETRLKHQALTQAPDRPSIKLYLMYYKNEMFIKHKIKYS